jgi:glycerophosphoryl diester phosphodiesterase
MNGNNLHIKLAGLILSVVVITIIVFIASVEREPKPTVAEYPKIFAHRGASDQFNESTITAYQIAAEYGVDALEIDLRMTNDGSIVVMHDETIDRTTNGSGEVSNYNLEELKTYQTVEVFNNETTMEAIPTLKELIDTFKDKERYYIETRLVNGELVMEEPLIQLLNEYDLIKKDLVAIQSFSKKSLEKIRELAPDIPLTMLFSKGDFDLKKALRVNFPVIGMESTDVTMKIVNELHRQGKEVHVFFNNSDTQKKEQERVKALNVDGYFTDHIPFTKKLLMDL